MKIGEFFKSFREEIKKQNNGKQLSVSALSAILDVKADTIRSCERGYMPRLELDREKIKSYFEISNLEEIQNEILTEAIKKFDLTKELNKLNLEKNDEDHVTNSSKTLSSSSNQKEDNNMNHELLKLLNRAMTQIEEQNAIIKNLTNKDGDDQKKQKVG